MARTAHEKAGCGKLLDAWAAPVDAGDPVGCLATSFTFSADFFEQECLARYLGLESSPEEDGPAYLIEREEKLAQVSCAAAIVDQHHCRGERSLRWDLLPARPAAGILHAKVTILHWSRLVRLIVASANLTEEGYRRNQEVFGVLDYHDQSDAPLSCLSETVKFLKHLVAANRGDGSLAASPWRRADDLLDRVSRRTRGWGIADSQQAKRPLRVFAVLTAPRRPHVFKQLQGIWPGASPPIWGDVISPFFDPPGKENGPARHLWQTLRSRGKAVVSYYVTSEDVPGTERILLHAPKSLQLAQPHRPGTETFFAAVTTKFDGKDEPYPERPLHAKAIWLEDDRWVVHMVGSSNFTTSGLGLCKEPNWEANLAYTVDYDRSRKAFHSLENCWIGSEWIEDTRRIQWPKWAELGEDQPGPEPVLPAEFGSATFGSGKGSQRTLMLTFYGQPPPGWRLTPDDNHKARPVYGESQWKTAGRPPTVTLPWQSMRPPSGLWVTWLGSGGAAFWPVNIDSARSLPPPDDLKGLSLDALISILASSRPLHRAVKHYRHRGIHDETDLPPSDLDPHRRVDTSGFILQRTRRAAWALNRLRERIERPFPTPQSLEWRLYGPVGVMALAEALSREAAGDEERAFLLTELALEIHRARPKTAYGCLSVMAIRRKLREIIKAIRRLLPTKGFTVSNLNHYVSRAFRAMGDRR